MAIGLIGQKCGMSRVFLADGTSVPVTVVLVQPNRVTQVKTLDNDGYTAIQVTNGTRKASHVTKPEAGHFAKASVEAGKGMWEFRTEESDGETTVGSEITVSLFTEGQYVDVAGISKGKGFAGTVKRYNFRTQDATHGNSRSHRVPGSTGQNQTPGRVFPGKKMCGHMGNVRRTQQNLQVVRVDTARNLLLIKGAVPGAKSGMLMIQPAVKKIREVQA